jgi:hypothetical protein
MKTLLATLTLALSFSARAYNSVYHPVQLGQHTLVKSDSADWMSKGFISLTLKVQSRSGEAPRVQLYQDRLNHCQYRQTLLLFSGYDLKTGLFSQEFEVQILRKSHQPCFVRIEAMTGLQNQVQTAFVTVR